jgi:hypothetical protein
MEIKQYNVVFKTGEKTFFFFYVILPLHEEISVSTQEDKRPVIDRGEPHSTQAATM